jgi:hypothetical protein
MPEEIPVTAILVLLSVNVGLVAILFFVVLGLRGKIKRLEQLLVSRRKGDPAVSEKASAGEVTSPETEESNTWDVSPGGPFDRFLSEDPSRRNLAKKEQSIAYRKWRQQNGLNWSNS